MEAELGLYVVGDEHLFRNHGVEDETTFGTHVKKKVEHGEPRREWAISVGLPKNLGVWDGLAKVVCLVGKLGLDSDSEIYLPFLWGGERWRLRKRDMKTCGRGYEVENLHVEVP